MNGLNKLSYALKPTIVIGRDLTPEQFHSSPELLELALANKIRVVATEPKVTKSVVQKKVQKAKRGISKDLPMVSGGILGGAGGWALGEHLWSKIPKLPKVLKSKSIGGGLLGGTIGVAGSALGRLLSGGN